MNKLKVVLEAGEFSYVAHGDEDAPPMVLVHGSGASSKSWDLTAPTLAEHRRVYAMDIRGHGDSVWTPTYSFEEMADDLLQFVDELGLEDFLLCGHSMGGTISAIFAERYPDRLSGLVLIDSPPPDGSGEWKVPPRPEDDPGFDWELLVAVFDQLANPDPAWWSDLPKISAPTLVIGGGTTSPVPQHLLADVVRLVPDATLVTIEGAGHQVHQTRPAEFLTAVASRFGN